PPLSPLPSAPTLSSTRPLHDALPIFKVGTSIFFKSSVKSVSEKALMQSMTPLKPACIPCIQNESRSPCDTFAPGRLAGFKGVIEDRKSTRLNSSHSQISYAVFCLKKK